MDLVSGFRVMLLVVYLFATRGGLRITLLAI
jgi:hypothetical protein